MTGGRTNPKQDATEAFRNNEFAAYGPLTRHEQGGQRPHGARARGRAAFTLRNERGVAGRELDGESLVDPKQRD